jgi:hypothetical protein
MLFLVALVVFIVDAAVLAVGGDTSKRKECRGMYATKSSSHAGIVILQGM